MLPSNAGKIDKLFLLPPATISSVPIYDFADTHMGWQLYIIHVAERVFVEDVSTHLVRLETMRNVRFAMRRHRDKFRCRKEAGGFK